MLLRTLFFILLITAGPLYKTVAQVKLTDSLQRELTGVMQDTSRVLLLSELCLQYRLSNPDSAMGFGQQALQLARQIDYTKGEIDALGNIGFVMREIGNLPNALKLEFKAYQLAQANGDFYEMGRIRNIIGNIYLDLKDFDTALTYYQQARQNHTLIRNKIGLAITESNIGSAYEQMNQLDSAWTYEYRAYQNVLHLNLINNLPYVLRILGNIQTKWGDLRLAMTYYQKSKQVAVKENNLRNVAFANMAIARLYSRKHQLDSCLYYAKTSLQESQQGSYKRGVLMASTLLAETYQQVNDREALRYYKLAAETKDYLYGEANFQAIRSIAFDEQERQRDLESAQLKYQHQVKQYTLLISLAILLLIALILWRNNLQKQKANALLFQQKVKISQQSDQLALLMQELHHRVKNNFAIVASLLNLQSHGLKDEKAIQAMRAGQQRIEAMSLIHQRLYMTDQLTSVNMEEYLTDLATGLTQAYGYHSGNFELVLTIEQKQLDVDAAMPLGLIGNELITNSLKHAYSNVPRPWLGISLFWDKSDLVLEVYDNGSDLDLINWEKKGSRISFGKQLISSLSNQLGARVEVRQQGGARFRIYVPSTSLKNAHIHFPDQAMLV